MFNKLLKLIGTRPGEENVVSLLLAHGFFMGIFIATYQLSAETLFTGVKEFSEHLDSAFLIQGFLGVISTFLFAFLQNRWRFSNLIVMVYLTIFVFLIVILMYIKISFHINLIYILFVMLGPLTAIVLLSFWGIFGRLFDLRQSKRIIGGIDTGQLTGTILAFITVSLLSKFNIIDNSINLIFISAISVLGAIFFLLKINKNYDLNIVKTKSREEAAETRFSKILKSRYVILLSVFITVSVVVYKFVDYSFLQVTPMQFPDEQIRLTFLSVFNGGIMILSFLIQTFVNDRIIMNYGLKVSLMVLPTILMIFTFAAIITASVFGYTNGAETKFIYFFLCITLSKLFATSVRDALESPAFKLFFLSLDAKIRFDIQTKVEGVINQFGNIFAGGILVILGLSYFTYIELVHYSILLIFILVGMMYVIFKLYNQYRTTLKQKLKDQQQKIDIKSDDNEHVAEILINDLTNSDPHTVIFSLKILEIIEPVLFEEKLIQTLSHPSELVREYTLKKIEKNKSIKAQDQLDILLDKESSENLKSLAAKVARQMKESDQLKLSQFQFFILIKSENPLDREFAARFLKNYDGKDFQQFLLELLSDENPRVRGAALVTTSKINNPLLWNNLIENLSLEQFSGAAFAALVSIGEPVMELLENAFYKTDQKTSTMVQIVKIYGRIGGEKAIRNLWNKMDFPNKNVVSQALQSLGNCNFRAEEDEVIKIKNYINTYIGYIVWNIAAITELPSGTNFGLLKSALEEENKENFNQLYLLLSLIYDKQSIHLVRENINSGTADGVTFAIELLDVFISEDLKTVLVPVLDDITHEETLKRLQEHFPRAHFDVDTLLLQIINRDYNCINLWTKSCAIFILGLQDDVTVSDDLIANLFNPDSLIREMAAWAIYQINADAYEEHTSRISDKIKKELDETIIPHNLEGILIRSTQFHKVLFLRKISIFTKLPGIVLTSIARKMVEVNIRTGDIIFDYDQRNKSVLVFLVKGKAEIRNSEKESIPILEGTILGDLLVYENSENNGHVIATADSTIYTIERETLYGEIPAKFHSFKHVLPEIESSMHRRLAAQKLELSSII